MNLTKNWERIAPDSCFWQRATQIEHLEFGNCIIERFVVEEKTTGGNVHALFLVSREEGSSEVKCEKIWGDD